MLISLAVDCHHADVGTREQFHLTDERAARAAGGGGAPAAVDADGVAEVVTLATCNRSELYAWVPGPPGGAPPRDAATLLARRWMGSAAGARRLLAAARHRDGPDAALHLLRVAAGLESQVLGDGQILGQLREAYARAREAGAAGQVLGRLFDTALHVGKRVRTETGLLRGPTSVGAAAAAHAARRMGTLAHARVVVVGCGKTGMRAARQLVKLGARDVVLVNRSLDRAESLARAIGGRAAPLAMLHGESALADVVIVATGAESPVLHADPLVVARRNCATTGYPLLVLDLAMPRNVDPAVGSVPSVVLVDLDTLNPVLSASAQARRGAVPDAERIVTHELRDFAGWIGAASARAAIHPLRATLHEACVREVRHAGAAAGADALDDAVVSRVADRIVAKVLAQPMRELRQSLARGERVDDLLHSLTRLFATPPAPLGDGR